MFFFFFFNDTATTEIYTLSLHDALPISERPAVMDFTGIGGDDLAGVPAHDSAATEPLLRAVFQEPESVGVVRSEEHTSELQSPCNLVCRLLLEKKKQSSGRHNRCARYGE